MVESPIFWAQTFSACFFESLDSVEQAEIEVPNDELYYQTKFLAHLIEEAIKKANFDFTMKFKTQDTQSLEAYIENFFNNTTKLSSEVEKTIIRLDQDLAFTHSAHVERLDSSRTNYIIVIDPETYQANSATK